MLQAHNPDTVRAAERRLMELLPDGELMRRAASGLAGVVRGLLPTAVGRPTRLVVLVGSGDNGGDALFAAAALARRPGVSLQVTALCIPGPDAVHPAGRAAAGRAGVQVLDIGDPAGLGDLARADLVLDGILGIGGRPGLSGRAADAVRAIPLRAVVIAVDLPSGADPEGRVADADTDGLVVTADHTVTFGCPKPVHLMPGTAPVIGRLHVVDIGLEIPADPVVQRLSPSDVAAHWPSPGPGDDKYSRGVLGVVAGSDRYPGAAVMVTSAAVHTGVGMVRYVGPPAASASVVGASPEVVSGPGRVQAYALGSGLDVRTEGDPSDDVRAQTEAIRQALAGDLPCLVDAGALDLLDVETPRSAPTLLTPHAGELARLWGRVLGREVDRAQVQANPVRALREVAAATGATVLLKGSVTLVGGADGPLISQGPATPFLATAGAGDTLAGVAGALLATGLPPATAGACAALVHAEAAAGDRAPGPLGADDLVRRLAPTIARLLTLGY